MTSFCCLIFGHPVFCCLLFIFLVRFILSKLKGTSVVLKKYMFNNLYGIPPSNGLLNLAFLRTLNNHSKFPNTPLYRFSWRATLLYIYYWVLEFFYCETSMATLFKCTKMLTLYPQTFAVWVTIIQELFSQ